MVVQEEKVEENIDTRAAMSVIAPAMVIQFGLATYASSVVMVNGQKVPPLESEEFVVLQDR